MKTLWFYSVNCLKNALMLLCPGLIIRLRKPTGTGNGCLDSDERAVLDYAESVFEKYVRVAGGAKKKEFLAGKTVLELGPGDTCATALFFLAHGADKVICCDRFPLMQDRAKNTRIAKMILGRLAEAEQQTLRERIAFDIRGNLCWDTEKLQYLCDRHGRIALPAACVDLVVSNAVLEHVDRLDGLFENVTRVMKPGAVMVHAADLGSHQMHISNPLDFMSIPQVLWVLMTSHRGAPNRLRKSDYERLLRDNSFEAVKIEVTDRFDQKDVDAFVTRYRAGERAFSHEDLSCESILFYARKPVCE